MPHFNPDTQRSKNFRLFEKPEKNFFTQYVLPGLIILAFFLLVRITMVASGITLFKVPLLDPAIKRCITFFKEKEYEQYLPQSSQY